MFAKIGVIVTVVYLAIKYVQALEQDWPFVRFGGENWWPPEGMEDMVDERKYHPSPFNQ